MDWDRYQGGAFREYVGAALWGEKAGDVAVGGKYAGKLARINSTNGVGHSGTTLRAAAKRAPRTTRS